LHGYPITIALHHDASLSVLQLLVDAAPDVLVQVDGDEQGSALSTALMQKRDLSIISLLLEANPDQVRVHDRYRNYPLHASCIYGACLKVVQLVASAYPSALRKKNFHGMTPLDIAQRNAFCSDDVIDYLQQTSFGSLEEDAIHMEDSFIVKEDTGKTIASCKRVGNAACQSKHPAGV
jgi:ankyrin repeat protein